MQDQSRPIVPLPEGSGTYEGEEGLVPLAVMTGRYAKRRREDMGDAMMAKRG